ncbi:MAG: hypothetical protein WA191_08510 [Telluria sp.]
MINIVSSDSGLSFESDGLRATLGYEIFAAVNEPELSNECRTFVRFVCDCVLAGNSIRPDETLGYGYWITKAVANDRGYLEFWEYTPEASHYVPGVSNTLRYWHDQHQVCERASSVFAPPKADQMIVISDGVYEGDHVQGVRYPSPPHMSGWWLTTDRYDGNADSLKTVHLYHLTERRPDLTKFIALSPGYRFYSDNGEVKFDQKVFNSTP